ncbi:MAG TPA: glycosyltransferase family 4 protein [Alphaproteobacteria bacterium]
MDILYIGFDVEGVGGIATYSRHQVRALRDLGHSPYVLSVDKQSSRFTNGYADRHVPFDSRAGVVAKLLAFIAAPPRRFDVVMLNHVYLAMFGRLARALRGSPYILNVYNIDILAKLPPAREYAFTRANLAIADCRYTIEHLPRFHDRMPPIGLLYDPVDTGFFRPIPKADARLEIARPFKLDRLDERFIAVTVAHMAAPPNNNKGHRQTIDALKLLADPRMLYLIVGEGPDRPAIEAYARQQGVEPWVKFLGLVPQESLPYLYAAADVAILVARGGPGLGEAVPLGLIEAAACGTPFICGNEDGSVEAIDPARPNGFAIDPARPDELAAKLHQLADDPTLVTAMGGNGQEVVAELFAYDRFVARQRELLTRALVP